VLRKNQVQVVQVKTREQCLENARIYPARWRVEGAQACDVAASSYFRGIGLEHSIYISGPTDKMRVENLDLLLRSRESECDPADLKRLARTLSRAPTDTVWSLQQLLEQAGLTSATAALRLLDKGALHSDFDRCRISVPAQCLVAADSRAIADHYAASDAMTSVGPSRTQMHSREIRGAFARQQELSGDRPAKHTARTYRRWRAACRRAAGHLLGLAPRHRCKGNRLPRVSKPEQLQVDQSIRTHYLKPECPSMRAAYTQYLLDHQESVKCGRLPGSSLPVSYTTFRTRCRSIPAESRARSRSGRRAANAHAHPVAPEHRHLTPARAFERGHIDHYLCDMHVLVGHTDKPETRRPWLTAMRDEATGAILAVALSFRAPSHLTCLHVIRDCARRHQRLPEVIVVDNGAEFHSTYFECVLAGLGITKQSRPPGNPRTGGPIEAMFHSVKAFLGTQKGNTTNDARGRSASRSHKGQRHAAWSIMDLFKALEEWAFQHFNHAPPPNSLHARSQLVLESLARFPSSGRPATFDAEFLAQTSAPLRPKLKIDAARGVRHLGRWFSHPSLFKGDFHGKHVKAFQEPWDLNRLYVRWNGELITCVHGSAGLDDLTVDFRPALESMLYIECGDVRAKQAKLKALHGARLARKWERQFAKPVRPPAAPRKRPPPDLPWPSVTDIAPYGKGRPS